MCGLLRLWFSLEGRVTRAQYAWSGAGLMLAKYGLEALAFRLVTGATWTPLDYLSPIYAVRAAKIMQAPAWFLLALGLWTLPFVWIGASMSIRRALDAGRSPWLGLLFLVPLLNYLVMLLLAWAPSAPVSPTPPRHGASTPAPLRAAFGSVAAITLVAGALLFVGIYVAESYGSALFLGLPFLMGCLSGYVYNRRGPQALGATLGVALLSLVLCALLLLLVGLEGLVCVALAFGLALPLVLAGAVFGRVIAGSRRPLVKDGLYLVLAGPFLAFAGRGEIAGPAFEVRSALEIGAPPERVWPHVIGFSELPAPEHWIFATGIAYPVRAEIEGSGVGALRRCAFSTGDFLEPITAWDPPRRLAFDVLEQPEPLEEWSFYRRLHPPHLRRTFRARRGEFRLSALPGGRTRLEASTWCELELAPLGYWRFLADGIVRRIHGRVLAHIRALAEG
jgi:uncharacterized membrane protein YhaH (DUF805 family)